MNYITTRDNNTDKRYSFEEVLFGGLAKDGGLYLPEKIPQFTADEITRLGSLNYQELAFKIIAPFLSIDDNDLKSIIDESYQPFTKPEIAPMSEMSSNLYYLELFHSPTLAFKDYALQFLGNLFQHFAKKNQRQFIVLGATSGDTGSAAIHAFKSKSNQSFNPPVFILFPHNKVSPLQRKQMTTIAEDNIHCFAIDGNFDDCQSIVKQLFNQQDFLKSMELMAVNSINWGRIMAQIVYYFYAYFKSDAQYPEKVVFSVPTGNFGNILAGYLAGQMGLPIEKFVLGTNENDILHRMIKNNDYSKQDLKMTHSPSMDIVVSSNLERYLYLLYRDGNKVAEMMQEFTQIGQIKLEDEIIEQIQNDFFSVSVTNDETIETIKKWSNQKLIDPHSAVAFKALEEAVEQNVISSDIKKIVIGTAHPAKFIETIEKANLNCPLPNSLEQIKDLEEKQTLLPNHPEKVKAEIMKILNS